MKKTLQVLGFGIILVGGFWVGMQWGSASKPVPAIDYKPVLPPLPQPVPETPQPIVSEEVAPTNTTPTEVTTEEKPTPAVSNNEPVDLPIPKNDTVTHYQSNYFKYGFDLPVNVYYSAFGASDGAQHTVAIAKELPETLSDGAIKVYFYGKKIVPELQNVSNNKYEDPAGKFIYLLLNGQYSVKIEANNISHPVVQKIVQSIAVSQ